jgi:hypothetical protein
VEFPAFIRRDAASPLKRGPAACGQIFAPPRRYSLPQVITDENGDDLIPLTVGETRRLFSLHTRITRKTSHHEHWSHWRRRHQARAQRLHYEHRVQGLRLRL